MVSYKPHLLSRIVTVRTIESADYIRGCHPANSLHFHQDAWEMCVCMQGEMTVLRDGEEYLLHAREVLMIRPGVYHDVDIRCSDARNAVISFSCENGDHLNLLEQEISQINEKQLAMFHSIIQEVCDAFEEDEGYRRKHHYVEFIPSVDIPLGAEQMICCYLEQVIISLLRSATMDQDGRVIRTGRFQETMQTRLTEQVNGYIQENLGRKLTVAAIASHFHYSRSRISTIYKEVTGLGINERIAALRIQRAKELLLDQQDTISGISERLGFSSPQYFSRKFSEAVGIPPSQYVQQMRTKDQ